MSIELPHYRQEKDNTCALACLRMVLAAYGRHVEERDLEGQTRLEWRGTPIEKLERLARRYDLVAEIQEATVDDLRRTLTEGKLSIAFIDRSVFDLTPEQRARHSIPNAIIHTVIPTEVTSRSVKFHDPRVSRPTRKSIRLFNHAYEALGGLCVVCSKPDPVR